MSKRSKKIAAATPPPPPSIVAPTSSSSSSASASSAPVSASSSSSSSSAVLSSPNDPHSYHLSTLNNGLTSLVVVDRPRSAAARLRDEGKARKENKKNDTAAKHSSSPSPSSSSSNDMEDVDDRSDSKPAVVALSVRVGHWSDPTSIPGLAHFCEHMLFLGNAKYRGENEWEDYLSSHGGASNAFTDAEYTCYYFEVNPRYLIPALERFAQFFVSPLFAASGTHREIRAVDSEFRDCINDDGERVSEILNSTAAEVNPKHPFCYFGWGNLESLETNLKPTKSKGDSKKSKLAGGVPPLVDLRSELKSFHARYYSSHAMKLVVYHAGGNVDRITKCIHSEFEAILNNGLPLTDFSSMGNPFVAPTADSSSSSSSSSSAATAVAAPAKAVGKGKKNASSSSSSSASSPSAPLTSCLERIYYIVPVREIYKLNLAWVITPSLHSAYASKPSHLAEHLLGHESRGSLYVLLRDKGWITSLVAGVNESGNHKNTSFHMMQLGISMTKDGAENHIDDILNYIFQYLSMMRSSSTASLREHYYELKQLSEISFLFSEASDPSDLVQDLAMNMHVYPAIDTIRGDFLHTEFDDKLNEMVFNALSVDNVRIDIAMPSVSSMKALHTAPWFGTRYTSQPIDAQSIARWKSYDCQSSLIDASLHLPSLNPFIPTQFGINTHASPADAQLQTFNNGPQRVRNTPLTEGWWHLDDRFDLPRSNVHMLLESPLSYASPSSVALSELLIKLWVDSINEYAYQASLAEFEYSIESLRSGIEIKLSGFSHRLREYVETITGGLEKLESFLRQPDAQTRFDSLKEKTTRHFLHKFYTPIKQANHARLSVLQQTKFAVEDITIASRTVTMEQLIAHLRALRSSMRIVTLTDGNMTRADAELMMLNIETRLCTSSVAPSPRVELCVNLPVGHRVNIDQQSRNFAESNHSVESYFQLGPATLFTRSILNVFESLIAEPAFDTLRTQQQLGYQLQTGVRNTHGVLGFIVSVQSASYDPVHLSSRIDDFLSSTFYSILLNMTNDKFTTQRSTLVAEFLYDDTHVGERMDRSWEAIQERSYCFTRPKVMAALVSKVSHAQVLRFYEHYFLGIRAEAPAPGDADALAAEADSVARASVSTLSSSSSSDDVAMPAVSSIQLDPIADEAQRKEQRKMAKKARKVVAAAASSLSSSSDASDSLASVDPAVAADRRERLDAAKLQPIIYRRHMVVSIYGHADAKKSSKDGQRNNMSDDEEGEDDEGEDDDDDEDMECDDDDEDDAGDKSDSDDADIPASTHIDTLWFNAAEWSTRQSDIARKIADDSAAAVLQPIKKQKNGKNKQTHTHAPAAASAQTAASSSSSSSAANSNCMIMIEYQAPSVTVPIRFDDGLSSNCECANDAPSSSSSSSSSSSAAANIIASRQGEHQIHIRTIDALTMFKSSSKLHDQCDGPEPDLPISVRRG